MGYQSVPQDLRWAIIGRTKAGQTKAFIMEELCLGRAAVDRWAAEAQKRRPNVLDMSRSGRPCKFSKEVNAKVRRAGLSGRSPGEVSMSLKDKGAADISQSSVRSLWLSGRKPIMYCPVRKSKVLREPNVAARLAFVQNYKPTPRHPWAFTDGKQCSLHRLGNGDLKWRWQRVDKPAYAAHGALVARFFFYAVVGKDLKSQLFFTAPSPQKGSGWPTGDRAFNSSDYIGLLKAFERTLVRWRPQGGYDLIRDRASQHTSAASTRALAGLNLSILEAFPAQSWDINIIENVWAQLALQMKGHRATTADGFRRVITQAWSRISQGTVNKIVADVPKRLKKIASLKGKWIDDCKKGYRV